MKLTVRMVKTRVGIGGVIALMCDESGVPLPNQTETQLTSKFDDLHTIRVDFVIDGSDIRMVESAD